VEVEFADGTLHKARRYRAPAALRTDRRFYLLAVRAESEPRALRVRKRSGTVIETRRYRWPSPCRS
jgi:hypothetical protein